MGATFVVAVVLGLIGSVPATYGWGHKAGATIVVACLVSWLTGCIGAVPLAAGLCRSPAKQAEAILAATTVRFFGALVLVVPLVLSGWFDRVTFVAAFIGSYLVLLLVDTLLVVQWLRRRSGAVS